MGYCPHVADAVRQGQPLPDAVRRAIVFDRAGGELEFGQLVAGKAAVVVFLRHFGCLACAEQVSLLSPRLYEFRELGFECILVGNGEPNFIDGFAERTGLRDKSATVVTDPSLVLYQAAGLVHSTMGSFGPLAWPGFVRARLMGFRNWFGEGDPAQQGGCLVLDAGGVVVLHVVSRYLGDQVDADAVHAAALGVIAGQASRV